MKRFEAKIKHDNGIIYFHIVARNKKLAIKMIAISENCPKSAIKIISKLKLK